MSDLTKELRDEAEGALAFGEHGHAAMLNKAADRIDALEECLREALPHIQGNGGAWEDMANRAPSDKAKEVGKFKAAEAYALRDKARALLEDK